MNSHTTTSTHTSTPAALRHRDRIARLRQRIATARQAESHAWRRRDRETATMWRDHAAELQAQLNRATTAAL